MSTELEKVTVLGAGSWGTALGKVLLDNGHPTLLWTIQESAAKEMNTKHTNSYYFGDLKLPEHVQATTDLKEAVAFSDILLIVIPTNGIRDLAKQLNELITTPKLIIHASKGIEQGTHKRISEILEEEIAPEKRQAIVALSGPSHAEGVMSGDITTITSASKDLKAAEHVQKLFMNDDFRVYTNNDILGVELGAAVKNVIAIGAGILDGLGYGDNAIAALVTRGMVEIKRFGEALGADPTTFDGLSGIGDLIVTCQSEHSRNRQAGKLLGKGVPASELSNRIGMIIEGMFTVKSTYEFAQELGIEMPITEAIYRVIYEDADPRQEILALMRRDKKSE